MEMKPVTSSNIKSVGIENGVMHIQFINGNVYSYTGPGAEAHYQALLKAPSAGSYFAAHVRKDANLKAQKV